MAREFSALVMSCKRLNGAGGTLTARNPRPNVRRAFEIVGLSEWIEDQL